MTEEPGSLFTQRESVEMHLRSNKTITPFEALRAYGCFRLGSIIHRLRRDGWQIETRREGAAGHARYTLIKAGA